MGLLTGPYDAKVGSEDYTEVVPHFDAPYSSTASQPQKQNVFLRWRKHFFNTGWRGQVIRVAIFSTSLWLLNVAVYIALYVSYGVYHGSGVLMRSSCHSVEQANTGIHAALNIVTSLMLGASTFAMESLCCPTREEVDAAHAKMRWLGIGGLSLRNFIFISKTRSILWLLLWITSIPLHLFFNAVFFKTTSAHQYAVAVVTSDFFNDTAWIPTANNSAPSNFDALGGYVDRAMYDRPDNNTILTLLSDARGSNASVEFEGLSSDQCRSLYATGFLQEASDVVVVTRAESKLSSPLLWTRYPERSVSSDKVHSNQDPFNWICRDALHEKTGEKARENDRCTPEVVYEIDEQSTPWTVYGGSVQYCLSRPYPDQCALQFNVWLMLAVLVCGFIKTVVIAWICVRHGHTKNLRTFGDAVSSFLERKDETTKDLCLVQSSAFVNHGLRHWEPQRHTGDKQRWYISAGVKQFWITIALTVLYAAAFGTALHFAIRGAHGTAFDYELGQVNIQALAQVSRDRAGSSEVIPNLLVANIPQLAFSILYMAYNDIFAKIHMAVDFNEHGKRALGLRVSDRPQGAQLGNRFFHLPIHWGLSIIMTSAIMHWLASQALFPVRVDGVNNNGVVDVDDQMTRLGYNCRALTAMVCGLVAVALVTTWICCRRKFNISFGEVGNSLVISAACHPPSEWNVAGDMGLKEVSWGDVTVDEVGKEVEVRHCSFAPMPPRKPIVGAYYS